MKRERKFARTWEQQEQRTVLLPAPNGTIRLPPSGPRLAACILPRFERTAILLPNGQVLVAGGLESSYNSLASAEVYTL